MNREQWWPLTSQYQPRSFPCPACRAGRLNLASDSMRLEQPSYNLAVMSSPDFEPDWIVKRFAGVLQCDQDGCGEYAVFSGDIDHVEEIVEIEGYNHWGILEKLRIRTFFPAPPIIAVPDEVPKSVRDHIIVSFGLYWQDYAACAARIRAGVEAMLDDLKVPTTKTLKNGSAGYLTLNERIRIFEDNDPENAESLDALRMLGNIGAHELGLASEKVLDAYEILEYVFQEVYEKKTDRLKALRKKIICSKGKY